MRMGVGVVGNLVAWNWLRIFELEVGSLKTELKCEVEVEVEEWRFKSFNSWGSGILSAPS